MSSERSTEPTVHHSGLARTWMVIVGVLTVGIAVGVAILVAVPFAVSESLSGSGDAQLQLAREVGCISYANGVLDLAKQGYTAEQIQKVYEASTAPEPGSERVDEDAPSGVAIRYCGSPQRIIDNAK
jgi:hypothetical protein